jgi:hypothetical protein
MGREHFYTDRAIPYRVTSRKQRGEVLETEEQIYDEIACVLVHISGKEDRQSARTYLPERGIVHFLPQDTNANQVALRQGDTLVISFMTNGVLVDKPQRYKIVGDILQTRRNSEIVSYTAEVRMDTEH